MDTPSVGQNAPLVNAPEAPKIPGALELVKESFAFFKSSFSKASRTSMWFIVLGLINFALNLVLHVYRVTPIRALVLQGLLVLVIGILSFFFNIKIMVLLLNLEAQKTSSPDEETAAAKTFFWPILWVTILTSLAVLGGILIFIIPGIYLSTALMFGSLYVIDQNMRGTHALAASRALIKGRWWATWWRMLVFGFIAGLLSNIASWVMLGIIKLISGFTPSQSLSADPLSLGVSMFVQMALIAFVIPLSVAFQIKLYRALQRTR